MSRLRTKCELSLSVHAPYSRIIRVKHKKGGLPNAEVTQKTDTKGEAYRMFLHRDNPMQCQGFEQSVTLKISLSVHTPYSRTIRVKHKKGGLPNAEVTQKTDTKGEAYRMFLHRDNPMQCQGFEQSVTLKLSLSVHAPYSRTIRVKHKKRGVTQCRGHPEDRYQGRSLQDVLTQR